MYRVNFSVERIDGINKAVAVGVIRSDHKMTEEEIKELEEFNKKINKGKDNKSTFNTY